MRWWSSARRREVPHWDTAPELAGVGGLRSTLADMLKLASALARRRVTPLEETIALALTPMRPPFGENSTGYYPGNGRFADG